MEIEERTHGEVVVLRVSADMSTGPDVAPFHDRIRVLTRDGKSKVVVDCSQVPWFGSAMLGVLIGGVATLRKAGGDICLAGLSDRMFDILKVSHLNQVFKTATTPEEAVASFRA